MPKKLFFQNKKLIKPKLLNRKNDKIRDRNEFKTIIK